MTTQTNQEKARLAAEKIRQDCEDAAPDYVPSSESMVDTIVSICFPQAPAAQETELEECLREENEISVQGIAGQQAVCPACPHPPHSGKCAHPVISGSPTISFQHCRCLKGIQTPDAWQPTTIKTWHGETVPAILVSADWIVRKGNQIIDHGCSLCIEEDNAPDFICTYHRAKAALASKPDSQTAPS